jgi:integrase
MINRANWKLVNEYLQYRKEINQISISSMRLEESYFRNLLEWADNRSFEQAPKIRPSFPEYMLTARQDGSGKQLSPIYITKVIAAGCRFFGWLRVHKSGFRQITSAWLDTLKPPRMAIEQKEHEAVTLEEIIAIAKAPVFTMRDRRIRAAAIFWFLSGIRIGAFVTLRMLSVDLEKLEVYQFPNMGVRTKNKKHATTFLLPIPELLEVVKDWDHEVRKVNPDGLWFAKLETETANLLTGQYQAGEHRHSRARLDLKEWLKKVGLPYHSPHKFRHGHAVYCIKNAKDIQALKAISQNLMHANLSITDGVYGILSEKDIKNQIQNLGKEIESMENQNIVAQLRAIEASINHLKKSMGV